MSDDAPTSAALLNVLVFEVGTNMGDHAETIIRAVDVDPAMPIGEVARKFLAKEQTWHKEEPWAVQDDWKIEIRLAKAEVKK